MDAEIRAAAFQWIRIQYNVYAGAIPWRVLSQGFDFQGQRITLVGAAGIWKPKQLEAIPISITSTQSGPYDDSFNDDGLLLYRYRGTDLNHRDNVGLREALHTQTPLIYFHGIGEGRYLPIWPVFIKEDHPDNLAFLVAIDPIYAFSDIQAPMIGNVLIPDDARSNPGIRKYVAAFTLRRLHQTSFREAVIMAYSSSCALCRLKHRELLDAAHIIADTKPKGGPIIPNGLCLCKIHHAAFDQNIVGITPDYAIHVRPDVLGESDGPMLLHGLQGLHKGQLIIPQKVRDRPDPMRLEIRYNEFLKSI